MARIKDIHSFNGNNRDRALDGDVIKVKNKRGDTLLLKPSEVNDVIMDLIQNQLGLFTDRKIKMHEDNVEKLISNYIGEMNKDLNDYLNDRFDKISEDIIHRVVTYKIEEEVNRRVENKLKKVLKNLDN